MASPASNEETGRGHAIHEARGQGSGTHLAPRGLLHVGATPWKLARRSVTGPFYQRALERCLAEAALAAEAHAVIGLQLAAARPAPTAVSLTTAGDALVEPLVMGIAPQALCTGAVALTSPVERERAVTLRRRRGAARVYDRKTFFEAPLIDDGLHDFARRLLFDGEVYVGSMLLGRRLESPFGPRELDRIDRVADEWAPWLGAALTRDAERLGPSAALVLTESGEPRQISSGAASWLEALGPERLAASLPLQLGSVGPRAAFVDGVLAEARELWRRGQRDFLVTLRPMAPVTIHPAAALTHRQREVAACARNGASAAGIADALGISIHTVRQHLRAAYRTLGVSNRVELRLALDDLETLGLAPSPVSRLRT